jgi:hypothetical protein
MELDDELEALQQEELDNKMLTTANVPVGDRVGELPSAPQGGMYPASSLSLSLSPYLKLTHCSSQRKGPGAGRRRRGRRASEATGRNGNVRTRCLSWLSAISCLRFHTLAWGNWRSSSHRSGGEMGDSHGDSHLLWSDGRPRLMHSHRVSNRDYDKLIFFDFSVLIMSAEYVMLLGSTEASFMTETSVSMDYQPRGRPEYNFNAAPLQLCKCRLCTTDFVEPLLSDRAYPPPD